jgi:beta-glucosidase
MKRLILLSFILLSACCTVERKDGYQVIHQCGGPDLGFTSVPVLRKGSLAFKDLNRNTVLDPYEDWRLSPEERAADLSARLTPEYLSGLMTNGHTVNVPGISSMSVSGITYNGLPYAESGAEPSDICDKLREALENFDTRQVLLAHSDSPETIARWNNKVQALVESLPFGIPCANSTDPRNEIRATDEYNAGSGGVCSQWPTPLGLAATFDTAVVADFARTVKREYLALGFRTALSPQADLATEPRWRRVPGTFGENPALVAEMVRTYIREMQPEINCIEKHWPGGGTGEGGRDAHLSIGKYGVFPGGRLKTHMDAFDLSASGIMPYYTISFAQDPSGENVGNSYSSYMIDSLLRKEYGYEGIACTDWGIVANYNGDPLSTGGKCYGVEGLTCGERIFKALEAGIDEFGGSVKSSEIMDAWKLWRDRYGEDSARERWERSARKILEAMMRTGVFENPYVDVANATAVLSDPETFALGEQAQVRSVVMVKNHGGVLPMPRGAKVYVPRRPIPGVYSMTGRLKKAPYTGYSVDTAMVAKYFTLVGTPQEADFAIVAITEPEGGIGYKDGEYMPISLQYSPYTATEARDPSIAGGDPSEKTSNRSYKGRTLRVENETDLTLVRDTEAAMNGKPVVVLLQTTRPVVMEFEPSADAILVAFGVRSKAFMELISGERQPSGRLPMQFPASMAEVERQKEDVPQDMTPWKDTEGNLYDYGFGLCYQE